MILWIGNQEMTLTNQVRKQTLKDVFLIIIEHEENKSVIEMKISKLSVK